MRCLYVGILDRMTPGHLPDLFIALLDLHVAKGDPLDLFLDLLIAFLESVDGASSLDWRLVGMGLLQLRLFDALLHFYHGVVSSRRSSVYLCLDFFVAHIYLLNGVVTVMLCVLALFGLRVLLLPECILCRSVHFLINSIEFSHFTGFLCLFSFKPIFIFHA